MGDLTPRHTRIGDRYLRIAEDILYYAIAVILIVGAGMLLVAQCRHLFDVLDAPTKEVLVEILDGLLLVFIFVELLFAVRATLARREIVAEPFLIVGIIASIKEIVVLAVRAADLVDDGPKFARALAEVGVLGGLVLALAGAALLLRLKERSPEEGDSADNTTSVEA